MLFALVSRRHADYAPPHDAAMPLPCYFRAARHAAAMPRFSRCLRDARHLALPLFAAFRLCRRRCLHYAYAAIRHMIRRRH